MVEHLPCKQGVRSSTLLISTKAFYMEAILKKNAKHFSFLSPKPRQTGERKYEVLTLTETNTGVES